VTLLPRPDGASTWTLDPEFVAKVSHAIQREDGWETTMEVVQLAMLAAEKHILELFPIPSLSTRTEELEAKLVKALGALEDIHGGEPEWPEEPQKELDWCRERARTALEKMKGENT